MRKFIVICFAIVFVFSNQSFAKKYVAKGSLMKGAPYTGYKPTGQVHRTISRFRLELIEKRRPIHQRGWQYFYFAPYSSYRYPKYMKRRYCVKTRRGHNCFHRYEQRYHRGPGVYFHFGKKHPRHHYHKHKKYKHKRRR